VLEVLYHRAKFDGARISTAAKVAKNVEFFCLFVRHTHLNTAGVRQVTPVVPREF